MNKRIDPRIFHKNTAEDYLRAAIETANWIDTLAVKTEYGRIWKALPEGQEGYREDVPMFTSKSMYDGSAGIGIFMIRLYEATSDERWLKEAEEAAAHIIATQVGSEWYQHTLHSDVKGIIPVPGWAAGSYNGPVGEAYFLEDLYQVTRKQEYRDFVLRTADILMEAASRDERGLFWRILLQMADLLIFRILYIVALESGNIWILPVRQPNLVRQLVENHSHQSSKLPGNLCRRSRMRLFFTEGLRSAYRKETD